MALKPAPGGGDATPPAPGGGDAAPPAGWTPIRLELGGDGPMVDWCYTAGYDFTDPFFAQTVERCLRHPCRLLFRRRTSMQALVSHAERSPGLALSGLVFHLSRCGSTLVAQMLAAVPGHLVVSEAAPVDSVARLNAPAREREAWLRAMVSALGQPRTGAQRRLVLKLDSWTALELPVFRAAFPGVPWMFLYRDPVDVLVSHLRRRGAHTIPGVLPASLFELDLAEAARMPAEEYCARVLARICEAALDQVDRDAGTVRFVRYADLPGAVTTTLVPLFGLEPSPGDHDRMAAAALRDAKNPSGAFDADHPVERRRAAGPEVHRAAERWLRPLYERLEVARHGQEAALPAVVGAAPAGHRQDGGRGRC